MSRLIETGLERDISVLLFLEHPQIPRLVDIVQDKEGNPCIIMEKCKQSLEDIIEDYKKRAERIPEEQVIRIFKQICIVLEYVHSQGIVHRDLNPRNILHKIENDNEIFLITDFGLALKPSINYSITAASMKTPFYASIE